MRARYRKVFGTLDRWTLRPCSHHVVIGDGPLYKTAKLWFQMSPTYRNNSFLTPLILHHTNYGMFPSLLEGCFLFSSCDVRTQHGGSELWFTCRGKNHTCLTGCRTTYMKCLPLQCLFLACLSWSLLPRSAIFTSFSACHGLLAQLVWAITLLVLLYLFCNRPRRTSLSTYISKVAAMHVPLVLAIKISPLPAISPVQNIGCICYAGKYTLCRAVQC